MLKTVLLYHRRYRRSGARFQKSRGSAQGGNALIDRIAGEWLELSRSDALILFSAISAAELRAVGPENTCDVTERAMPSSWATL